MAFDLAKASGDLAGRPGLARKPFGKQALVMAALVASAVAMSGCVGGTTYGTGVSQEEQTIDDLANMLTFRKDRPVIDYSARPDLVVPENKELVAPVEESVATNESEWPESPEERIARIRAEAEEAEKTAAGKLAFAQKQKTFRRTDGVKYQDAPIGQGVPNISCDPDGSIEVLRRCTPNEISKAVKAQREQVAYSNGPSRKFLTEPPVEYRTPAVTAQAGDLGYTEAELAALEAARKKREMEESLRSR